MQKKEESKKGINLMPENQRSKESGILSKIKMKDDFDFDFVSPKDSSIKKLKKQGPSFFDKLKNIFNRPLSFGESSVHKAKENKEIKKEKLVKKAKENKEIKKEEKITLHIPDKAFKSEKKDFSVDYKDSILDDLKQNKIKENHKYSFKHKENITLEDGVGLKKQGPSFWDKIKSFFTSKEKAIKVPKVPNIPAKSVVTKKLENSIDIEKINNIDILPKNSTKNIVDSVSHTKEEPIKKLEEVQTSGLTFVDTKNEEKKDIDFSIPSIPNKVNKLIKDNKEEKISPEDKSRDDKDKKESLFQKFHKPESRIRAKFLDSGGGVDLIPDSAKTRSWKQIVNLLLISSIGSAFVIALFYGFLFYKGIKIDKQNDNKFTQITNLEKQIISYKALNSDITQLGDEIKAVHKLLGFHIYWTNFFQLLEKYTISDVYYAGITAGNGGGLTLNATASDFDAIARQIKVLEQEKAKEFVTAVDVSSATYNEDVGVIFNITLVLNSSLFVYNEDYVYGVYENFLEDDSNQGE